MTVPTAILPVHPTCSMPATTRHSGGDFAAAGRAVTVRPVRAAITMLAQQMPPETRIAPVGEAGLRRQHTHLQNPQRRPPPDRRILICPATFSAFNSPREHTFSAEAIDDAKVVVIKRSALTALRRLRCRGRPAALRAHQLRIAAHAGSRLATVKSAQERVAGFLLEMADRAAAGNVVELPMSRQDIADYLGLTIETVSRTLTGLESAAAIEMPSSRRIVLRRPIRAEPPKRLSGSREIWRIGKQRWHRRQHGGKQRRP